MMESSASLFERPLLQRTGPRRGPANFYRAASDNPDVIGGVALDSLEAAATAAVRLGYRVAEAQIDRTARVAKRMRAAGDHAGGSGSDKKALDATEQLIFTTLMAGLGWFEGLASDSGNPLRRLATAQYRLLGGVLGLLDAEKPSAEPGSSREPFPGPEASPPSSIGRAMPRAFRSAHAYPEIRHIGTRGKNQVRRAVRIREWELAAGAAGTYTLTFYRDTPGGATISGELSVTQTATTLAVKTTGRTAAGIYTAPICDKSGRQLGYLEISL
jgi:hypothetical protein